MITADLLESRLHPIIGKQFCFSFELEERTDSQHLVCTFVPSIFPHINFRVIYFYLKRIADIFINLWMTLNTDFWTHGFCKKPPSSTHLAVFGRSSSHLHYFSCQNVKCSDGSTWDTMVERIIQFLFTAFCFFPNTTCFSKHQFWYELNTLEEYLLSEWKKNPIRCPSIVGQSSKICQKTILNTMPVPTGKSA